ncbi:MAG: ASPIC/UnbV domain-containing protein, partial [Phycisphaerales bacterium]
GSRIVLCRNDGHVRYTPEQVHEVPSSQGPLGFSAEDADADGDLDARVTVNLRERLYVNGTSITPGSEHGPRMLLMMNDGAGRFEVISSTVRVDPTARDEGLQWPTDVRVDFGNDGFEDLITSFGGPTFRQRIHSGDHKRHAGFLNLESRTQVAGPGTEEFIDVSALLGLDLPDDGTAFAVTDWNGDGQLDLWLRNRSGPQLRFLRNVGTPQHHWLALKLTGKTCNRDAVGAGVTVWTGERSITRQVEAGDGYLSQSSKWLHFGLGTAQKADRIEVRWPDGMIEEFVNLPADARYLLTQGAPQPVPVAQRSVRLADTPLPEIEDKGAERIVLEIPIPIPLSLASLALDKSEPDRAVLLYVWSHRALWSRGQMAILAQEYERIRDKGLEVLALNVDDPAQRGEAVAFLEERVLPQMPLHRFRERPAPANVAATLAVIVGHVCGEPEVLAEPVTLLLDPEGTVQAIYRGHVEIGQILKDAEDYAGQSRPQGDRGVSTGRWFSPPKRDGSELAERLKNAGFVEEAEFYMRMARSVQP